MATKDLATARSHALFVCDLQPSEHPDLDEVRAAIRKTVKAYGVRGCLVRVAQEYGDHPETAAPRMRWARRVVSQAYPAPRPRTGSPDAN